jgi:hypothetical protein
VLPETIFNHIGAKGAKREDRQTALPIMESADESHNR